jgi:hypothetical protein
MGFWTSYCFICGNPPYRNTEEKITNWMDKIIILTASLDTVKECYNKSGEMTFECKKNKIKYCGFPKYCFSINKGVFVHNDCYKYVLSKTGIKLRYDMFDFSKKYKYGKIEKYHEQIFNFDSVFKDNNEYMLLSPNEKNNKNIQRINKIIKNLNLKKNRIGPSISAKTARNNQYRIGNDGNIWIKKENKWKLLNEKIYTKIIKYSTEYDGYEKYGTKYKQIGEESTRPLFIIVYPDKKIIKIIGTDTYMKKI